MAIAANALVCRELRLRSFRNFAELHLVFPDEGAAIIGDNGSGKTNLLESIYYLEIFRSFRGAPDDNLVSFGAPAFHVRGVFEAPSTGRSIEVTAAFEASTRKKRVTVDGVEVERLADAIGRIGAVVFSPSDMIIVAGPPSERRRFLDIVLSLHEPGYLTALQRYRHALRQRNAALRAGAASASIDAFGAALVESGGRLLAARASWVAAHAEAFAAAYRRIGDGRDARLVYVPGVRVAPDALRDADAAARALEADLSRLAMRERDRGVTMAGPHRDDVAMLLRSEDGQVDLREFGSGGQMRTGAIALRLVEADTIRDATGRPPLVLLDDVFAELDRGRSRRVLEMMEEQERGQVILTAPKESDVELRFGAFVSSLVPWRIAAGRIET